MKKFVFLISLLLFGIFFLSLTSFSFAGGACTDECYAGCPCGYCQVGDMDCSGGNTCCRVCDTNPCPTPTQQAPASTPTPTPVPGGGPTPTSGGSTPTPSGPTPTPQCTANCSGEWCADIVGTSCTNDDHCTSPYKCNTSTNQCRLCTTPGKSCCHYCVPQGFGCDWNPCPLCKSCKKYRCLGVQPDVCSSNQFAAETLIPCVQSCQGVSCGAITCGVDVSQCFWDCDVGPNCQPLNPPSPPAADPKGWLNWANCDSIGGWACDESDYNQPIEVHIYDGNNFLVSTTANIYAEQDVCNECGGNCNHRFQISLPSGLRDGNTHQIEAYGINIGGG